MNPGRSPALSAATSTSDQAIAAILQNRAQVLPDRSLLVGISGIDGSGKGCVAAHIVTQLQRQRRQPGMVIAHEPRVYAGLCKWQ